MCVIVFFVFSKLFTLDRNIYHSFFCVVSAFFFLLLLLFLLVKFPENNVYMQSMTRFYCIMRFDNENKNNGCRFFLRVVRVFTFAEVYSLCCDCFQICISSSVFLNKYFFLRFFFFLKILSELLAIL